MVVDAGQRQSPRVFRTMRVALSVFFLVLALVEGFTPPGLVLRGLAVTAPSREHVCMRGSTSQPYPSKVFPILLSSCPPVCVWLFTNGSPCPRRCLPPVTYSRTRRLAQGEENGVRPVEHAASPQQKKESIPKARKEPERDQTQVPGPLAAKLDILAFAWKRMFGGVGFF